MMLKYLDIKFCVVFFIFCMYKVEGSSCDECDAGACEPPRACLAGRVEDACNCCYVCGRKERERCDYEDLNIMGYGKCGDNLECRVRNDLDWDDPPEAVCVCKSQTPLCGSDGATYENQCQLTEARYRRRDGLRAVSNEPCPKVPRIMTSPQRIRNESGSSAVMSCEARAWPVPTIQWLVRKNDAFQKLPGNSTRVAVQSRSGPGVDETTSWLLFPTLTKEDEGLYMCKAENSVGYDTANATVSVL